MDNNELWGMHLHNMRCKVTMEPKNFHWGTIVPCSIGFKDKNTDIWTNLFIDIIVGEKTRIDIPIQKGDAFNVSGRVNVKTWNDKPQFSCWADAVMPIQQQAQQPYNGFPSGPSEADDIPF